MLNRRGIGCPLEIQCNGRIITGLDEVREPILKFLYDPTKALSAGAVRLDIRRRDDARRFVGGGGTSDDKCPQLLSVCGIVVAVVVSELVNKWPIQGLIVGQRRHQVDCVMMLTERKAFIPSNI